MKLGVMTPDEWLQNTVGQANKNKGNNKGGSSSSSKKPSSSSSNSKNNGVFTGNFYQDYQTRKNTQKKQNSYGAQFGKTLYDTQSKKLQEKISSSTDSNARKRYQQQLEELRSRADATLPGGLAGMEENERKNQEVRAREQKKREDRIRSLQEKISRTTDRRARISYQQELEDLTNPLSSSDQRLGTTARMAIRDAKAQYDEGTELIRQGMEEEGKTLQEEAHLMAEYYRAIAGYSGGDSGEHRILPELTVEENENLSIQGKKALRTAKLLYSIGQKSDNQELIEQATAMGKAVRENRDLLSEEGLRAAKSKEPTVKRTDVHGRPIYTPTELEAEGQRNFFPAIWNQITGSLLSLGEAAHAATREAISNRNNTAYQSNQDAAAYWDRQARTAQTEDARKQAEENAQKAREMVEQLRAKEEVHSWSEGQWRLRQAAQQQETVQNSIDSPFGRLVNQAAMSALGMAPALGLSAVAGPAAGAALMGAQAAGGKAGELLSRGTYATEALGRGLVSGAIEGVTERIPIGNLLRIARGSGGASWLRNMARQAGIEATEESASYALNYAADVAARDPEAEFSLQDLLEGAAVGALTGGVLGGGAPALSGGTTAARGRTRGGAAAAQDAARQAVQEVTRETQAQMPSTPENPLLQTIQETRREREQAARMEPEEPQGPQSVLNQVVEQAAAERNARREADTAPAPEAPQTLAEREARYQQRYQDYMQRAQAASEDLSLQTPENYQALRSELDEIQNEYNGILQARRVESGEVSADYNTPGNHIDNRTTEDVENRSVKAFQFDHPQLHSYYVQAAQALMEDANWSLETQSNQKGKGTVARYSEALERAADLGLSRQEIIQVCQDIIADRGQENYAAAKKVELILDQMLSEGYTPNEALGNPDQRVGPNEAYLQAKEAIPGAVTRDSFEHYLRQNALAMDAGEVTEAQLRQEWETRMGEENPQAQPTGNAGATGEVGGVAPIETRTLAGYPSDATSPSLDSVANESNRVNHSVVDVIRNNRDTIADGGVLMELTGNEFSDRSRRLSDQVSDFFRSLGNRVTRLGFGDVALTRRGARTSVAHGIGRNKAITFAAVPTVIEDGQIIDEQTDWKDRGYGSVTIGGRVKINGEDYDVGVVVRRDNNSTDTAGRYYLHEVVLTNEEGDPVSFWTGARQGNSGDTVSPSTNIIQEEGATVNPELPEGRGAMSVGGAGQFATWQAETPESGFHPVNRQAAEATMENRGRAPSEVPRVNPQGRLTSKTASTLLNANITPNEFAQQMEDALASGQFSRMAYSDQRATNRAEQTIQDKGFQRAKEDWMSEMKAGRFNKDLSALGITLYNNAVNSGDAITAMDIASEMVSYGKALGQSLQAFNLINKMTPSGQLYAMSKQVENLDSQIQRNAKVNRETGLPEYEGIEIDPDLAQQFLAAETPEDRARIQDLIYRDIASKVPATWQDKFNSWRYLAMLGNPRTHIRNILGNLGFMPVRMMKNAVSGAIQGATGIEGRTRAPLNIANAEDRARLQAGWEDFKNVEPLIRQSSKYDDMEDAIDRYRTIFRAKPLEGLRQFNSEMLDREDMWFSQPAYAEALAEYLKANDISTSDFLSDAFDAERKQAAQEFAIREAQQATYRDMNAFSEFVTRAGRLQRSENKTDRAIGYLVEGVLPFKKTPANIAVRAVEYSPVGLAKSLTYDLAQVRRGNKTAAEAIDNISSGLVGTGLTALGVLMAAQGLVSGGGTGDDKQDDFNDLQGGQDYALNIGDYSFTLDWLAPEALPFFIGVELFNNIADRETGEDVRPFDAAMDALGRIADPMLEMSMLQSLNDLVDNVKYSDNGFASLAVNALTSYLGQFLPTIGGQIERTFLEDTRQSTYIDRDSPIPNAVQILLGNWANKIPGIDFQQRDYVDAWGRTESTGENVLIRALNNFLNPAYVSRRQSGELEAELQRLYDLGEGFEGVLPSQAQTNTQINDQYLTSEEYNRLQTTRGQTAYDILNRFVGTDAYNNMTDEQKAKFIERVYTYSAEMGKVAAGDNLEDKDSWIRNASKAQEEVGMDPGTFVELYTYKSVIDDEGGDETSNSIKQGQFEAYVDSRADLNQEQKQYVKDNVKFWNMVPADASAYNKARAAGFSDEEAQQILTAKREMDANGNGNYSNAELYGGIIGMTDDPAEQEKYWNALKPSNSTKSWNEMASTYQPVYQRTQAAKSTMESVVTPEHQTAFQAGLDQYGTGSRYAAYQAILSVEGASNEEKKAMYDYINAQRTSPWKASWSQMVANGGYPS
nr:MAG TPA: Large polyvalent protein-associated domain 3 [Caudoviricetes sp.]